MIESTSNNGNWVKEPTSDDNWFKEWQTKWRKRLPTKLIQDLVRKTLPITDRLDSIWVLVYPLWL